MGWGKAALIALAFVLTAADKPQYRPGFDPSQFKGPAVGTPNQVLVLGTPHLSGFPETFGAKALSLVLDKLAAFRPQIITIEAVSGAQCDQMRRYPVRYADTVKDYCPDTAPARAATGLDVPAATEEADRLLAQWAANPTAAERRHLAAIFLSAGDATSGLVQWLRLAPNERRAGDGLDAALVDRLEKQRVRRNENSLIAAELAARLGLERVYPVDDHTADFTIGSKEDEAAYGKALSRAWDNPATKQRDATDKVLRAGLGTPAGLLAMYRAYNQPDQAPLTFKSDFGAALQDPSPQGFGRQYVTYWETRNLRIAGNIRDLLGPVPGRRVLTIIGASHKGYLEAYLQQMHDIRLVDAEAVLR